MHSLLIRRSTDADALALRHLAQLDSRGPLAGPALVAEVDGEPQAALFLESGDVIADPFRRTAAIVQALRLRASQARPRTSYRRSTLRASSRFA
jgi:hypothetical protein